MGPSLNLLSVPNVVAGATYQVSAYVLLASPDSSNPTATMSTKTTDCATSGAFGNIATSAPLSSTAWTKVQGTFSFSNLPGPPTGLTLYFQSSSATDSFYIGDVVISELSPPPPNPSQQDNTGITSTFEDGGLDGWSSRTTSATVTNSTAAAHSGTHSLLTAGRTANFNGPQINVSNKMYNGSQYNLSAWVMLVPTDGSNHVINMSLQTTLGGNTSFPSITPFPGITVPADGNWHQISVNGYNMANSYDPGTAFVYLQTVPPSGTDLVSFYVDDFQLTYVAPPTIQRDIPSIYKTLSEFFPVGAEILSRFASFSFLFSGVQRGYFSFPGRLICRLTGQVVGSQPESDIDQPDEHWQFEHRADNSDKCVAGVVGRRRRRQLYCQLEVVPDRPYSSLRAACSIHGLTSIADSTMDQLRFETSSSIESRITTCSRASLFRPAVLISARM
jgi:hypothetical protein